MKTRALGFIAASLLAAGLQSAVGCDTGWCNDIECGDSQFRLSFETDEGELPAGQWQINARVEDGTLEGVCTFDPDAMDVTDCPLRWTTPPSRTLDAALTFTPQFEEAGELVAPEAFLTVTHPTRGPAEVDVELQIEASPTRIGSFELEYTDELQGSDESCQSCPGAAFETLML